MPTPSFRRTLQYVMTLAFGWLGLCAHCEAFSRLPGYHAIAAPMPELTEAGYDAVSDTFTAIDLGTFWLFPHPLDPYDPSAITDVVGVWSTTALVDAFGSTNGGAFVWIASSPSLGISTPTLLMAGPVLSTTWESLGFTTMANVDYLAPQLASLWGPIGSIELISFVALGEPPYWSDSPCPICTEPWQSSASFHRYSHDEVWGSPRRIPEPSSIALLALATIAMAFACRREAALQRPVSDWLAESQFGS